MTKDERIRMRNEFKRLANTVIEFNGSLMLYKEAAPFIMTALKEGLKIDANWITVPPKINVV